MREKIYKLLNKIYSILMMTSFFAGGLPLIPFIFAICIGGETGEAISVFLYKKYYPIVIVLASIAVIIGLIAMYINKEHAFSTKTLKEKEKEK